MEVRRVLAAACMVGILAGSTAVARADGGTITETGSAPAQARHWAAPTVERATTLGLWPWPGTPDSSLDDPITPADWNVLVATWLDIAPGPGADSLRQSTWNQTVGAAGGQAQITRQQAVNGLVWLLRSHYSMALGADPAVALAKFRDGNTVGSTEQAQVAAAAGEGLLIGWNDLLRPDDPLTRGEAVTLIVRLQDRYGAVVDSQQAMAEIIGRAPRGFGQGIGRTIDLQPEFLLAGGAGGATGGLAVAVDGAATTGTVAGLKAPEGFTWMVLDITMAVSKGLVKLTDRVTITVEDGPGSVQYPLDTKATMLLDSTLLTTPLFPSQPVRGLAVFAVPTSAKGLWYSIAHTLAATPEKPTAGGMMRGPLGEPVPAKPGL